MAHEGRRYPKHDWRGIAMLTQQLGELFEPSKAKLLDKQQEHEMKMFEAQQAWKLGEERLEEAQAKREKIVGEIDSYKKTLAGHGQEVLKASQDKYAVPKAAAEALDDNDMGTLRQMNALAAEVQNEILGLQKQRDNMVNMDTHATFGSAFSKTMEAEPTEERELIKGKDYKLKHDANRDSVLDWNEQNNALRDYLVDYYTAAEGEDGMTINVGGVDVENVTPTALAFKAGFQFDRERKDVDKTTSAIKKGLKKPGEYLQTMYTSREMIQNYEDAGLTKLKIANRKGSPPKGFTSSDVTEFTAAHELNKEAFKAYIKTGTPLPDDLKGVPALTDDSFYGDVDAYVFDEPKEFTQEGLTPEIYTTIRRAGNDLHSRMAFNIIENWEETMASKNEQEKVNMVQILQELKKVYNF